jgi:hypothetical protein
MKMSLELSKKELFFLKNKHKIIKKLENPIKIKKKTLYKRKKMKRKENEKKRNPGI